MEKRAAIFYDRLNGQLTVRENAGYRYLAMALPGKTVVNFHEGTILSPFHRQHRGKAIRT
jgi:hypothetical protein